MSDPKPKLIRLTRREKICYALGDVGNALAVSSVIFWLLKYLTDVVGLAAALAGAAMMIGRVWDAIGDPIAGWVTDHTNTRWGKRRPFLLFGAVPYAVFFVALWVVPAFQSQMALFAYIVIALLLFNTCFAFLIVSYASLTAAMTNDYDERTSLTGYRMVASQSAFLIGASLPSLLDSWVESPKGVSFFTDLGIQGLFGSWAATPRQAFMIMALLFSVLMVASFLTVFFAIRERASEGSKSDHGHNPFAYISLILQQLKTNKPFRISVSLLCLSECAAAVVASNLPYYIEYVLDMKEARTQMLMSLFVGAVLALPFWVMLARKYGKAKTYRAAMYVYIVVVALLPFAPAGNFAAGIAVALAGGMCNAAALMIPWAMIPDVVEYDELTSGSRREGLFYGGSLFTYKLATGVAIFLSATGLSWLGYVPNSVQTPEVVVGMKCLISVVPMALLFVATIVAAKHPLTPEAHREILAQLALKRNQGGSAA